MKIFALTSSRADYGIYYPLLKRLKEDNFFNLEIIAFGTHLSPYHGYTIQQIEKDKFPVKHKVESLVMGDSPGAISDSMALTLSKFSNIWEKEISNADLVFALGDRYEMFAAVSASVPFNIPVAHIHGGETTLGAMDDKFRHAITIISKYHFTSTEEYAKKVASLVGSEENIFNVGALSLDNLNDMTLLSKEQFKNKYNIDLSKPSVTVTFHPETVNYKKNEEYVKELTKTLNALKENYQIIITMPNADTQGALIRNQLNDFIKENDNVIGVETLGTLGYFSCLKHSKFVLGNSSSGIVEAASLNKYVINIGDRQKGRTTGDNVFHVPINKEKILTAVKKIKSLSVYKGKNIYSQGESAATKIIKVLKSNL